MFNEQPSLAAAKFKAATERMRAIIENPDTPPAVRDALAKVLSLGEQRIFMAQLTAAQRRLADRGVAGGGGGDVENVDAGSAPQPAQLHGDSRASGGTP